MIRLTSSAKINLGLRITDIRPDGCHGLQSVFYPIPWPRDEIWARERQGEDCKVAPVAGIESRKNIIAKAWQIYAEITGFAPGLKITLHKRVPMGAGLGGGSANAAAILKWLNARAPKPLPLSELIKIAARVGADVPFFLHDYPCRVSGKGEILRPLRMACQGFHAVLVCPNIQVSTAWAFQEWDKKCRGESICNAQLNEKNCAGGNCLTKSARDSKNSNSVEVQQVGSQDLHNDFEAVVFAVHPELPALKRELLNLGALGAAMSGSGSSIYGIFPNGTAANLAAAILRVKWPRVYCLPLCSHAGV